MRKATDTKERIVNAAASLFSSHGFAVTSIDDVVTAVGITKGAFYHHFKTKEQLCETVFDQAVASYHRLAKSVQDDSLTDEPLSLWFTRLIELQASGQWLSDRLLGRLSIEFTSLNADMQNKLKLFWDWCQSLYESLIGQTFSAKTASPAVEPSALARVFMAAHFGTVWLDRCAPSREDLTTVFESLLRLTFVQNRD